MSNNKYTLSIRVSSDGFFLSISDNAGTVLVSKNVPVQLFALTAGEIVSLFQHESPILDADYNDVRIMVETGQYVFVPEALFVPQETDTYFNFQFAEDKNNVVIFNRVEEWGVVNVFSLPVALNEALNELFPDEVAVHQMTYILTAKIRSNEDSLYVWIRPEAFDVVVLKDKKLLLMNGYQYNTPEDVAYYVLSIFEQLDLNIENTMVRLYQREKISQYHSLISQYIKNCEVLLQK